MRGFLSRQKRSIFLAVRIATNAYTMIVVGRQLIKEEGPSPLFLLKGGDHYVRQTKG